MSHATVSPSVSPPDLRALKPSRRSFEKTIIVGSNAAVIDESVWRPKIGSLEGRALTKALKREGMQPVKVFLKDQYEAAKVAFYSIKHATVDEVNSEIINSAFAAAGAEPVQRVSAVLRSIVPMFKKLPAEQTTESFKDIIVVLKTAGVLENVKPRQLSKRRAGRQNNS